MIFLQNQQELLKLKRRQAALLTKAKTTLPSEHCHVLQFRPLKHQAQDVSTSSPWSSTGVLFICNFADHINTLL